MASITFDRDELDALLARRGATGDDLAAAAGLDEETVKAARKGRPMRPRTTLADSGRTAQVTRAGP